jgi:hypothetical protein
MSKAAPKMHLFALHLWISDSFVTPDPNPGPNSMCLLDVFFPSMCATMSIFKRSSSSIRICHHAGDTYDDVSFTTDVDASTTEVIVVAL